jgi:hypothetical protein
MNSRRRRRRRILGYPGLCEVEKSEKNVLLSVAV